MDDFEVASRLLQYLARLYRRDDLDYASGPKRITGGRDAAIFGFALKGAPASLSGPLILRLNRVGTNPDRVKLEAILHNWLTEQHYPVPFVHVRECDPAPLGAPFSVMTRLSGHPLAHKIERIGAGGTFTTQARELLRAPAILRDITNTWIDVQLRLHALDPAPLLSAIDSGGLDPNAITFDGQLARLATTVERLAFDGLKPAVVWLSTHRPAASRRPAICHGDFHPLNILAEKGKVTGVIDWVNVVVAPVEMDVGSAMANVITAPFQMPMMLRYPLRLIIRRILRNYYRAYASRHALDRDAVQYFQVFRCIAQLVTVAASRAAGTGSAGTFDSDVGINGLAQRIRALSGIEVAIPARS